MPRTAIGLYRNTWMLCLADCSLIMHIRWSDMWLPQVIVDCLLAIFAAFEALWKPPESPQGAYMLDGYPPGGFHPSFTQICS